MFKISSEVNNLIDIFGLNNNSDGASNQAGSYAIHGNNGTQQPGGYNLNPNSQVIGFDNVIQPSAHQPAIPVSIFQETALLRIHFKKSRII